jgi:probable phosphoglycerate mutase
VDLLLIRHALPIRVEGADGPADPELSEHGLRQSVALAEWLQVERVDTVVTSPMARARQTAAPLGRARGLDPVVVDGIAEFDRDADHYVPIEELKAENDPRWLELLAGDTPEGFADTVVTSIDEVIEANRGRVVAVVCHGGVINAYLAHMLGIDRPLFFEPVYTAISRVRAAPDGTRSLVSVNETAHLRGVGITP